MRLRNCIDTLFHQMRTHMAPEAMSFLGIDRDRQELVFLRSERRSLDRLKGVTIPTSKGIAGWVSHHRRGLVINDPYSDNRFLSEIDHVTKFRTQALLAFPLYVQQDLVGVGEMMNPVRRATFQPEDLAAVEAMVETALRDGESPHTTWADILPSLRDMLMDAIPTEAISFLRLHEDKGYLSFELTENREIDKLVGIRLSLQQGLVGWVAREERTLLLEDAYQDMRFFQAMDRINRFRTKTVLCSPLFLNGQVAAVVQLINTLDERMFTETDQAWLEGTLAALAPDFAACELYEFVGRE